MATYTFTSEMQALVDATIAALPSGFKLRTNASSKGRLVLIYNIDSNYSTSPIVPVATLVKIQTLFGAKDVQVQAEYEAYARTYENSLGGPEAEIDFSGSCMAITILL